MDGLERYNRCLELMPELWMTLLVLNDEGLVLMT
jgi:hypothetical protein